MTIATTSSRMDPYAGNGSATAFPVTFPFLDNSHIRAILVRPGEDDADLVLDTDFTLTGAGSSEGGTLTFPAAGSAYSVLAEGQTLHILRVVPLVQEQSWGNVDALDATRIEAGDDRLTMVAQQLQEQLDRCVQWPVTAEDPDTAPADMLAAIATAQAGAEAAQDAAETAQTAAVAAAAAAESASAEAQAVAAGLDLPAVGSGDANKVPRVKADESGYELVDQGALDVGLPAITEGDASKVLSVKADESGYELGDAASLAGLPAIAGGDAGKSMVVAGDESGFVLGEPASGVPVGAILLFPASSSPTGFLECDGPELSQTAYADLYAEIGDQFGDGTHLATVTSGMLSSTGSFTWYGGGIASLVNGTTTGLEGYYAAAVGATIAIDFGSAQGLTQWSLYDRSGVAHTEQWTYAGKHRYWRLRYTDALENGNPVNSAWSVDYSDDGSTWTTAHDGSIYSADSVVSEIKVYYQTQGVFSIPDLSADAPTDMAYFIKY